MRAIIFVEQPANSKGSLQAQSDLGLHVRELLLHELVGGQGSTELFSLQRILPGSMPAKFSSAQSAPGDPVTRFVQTAEGTLQTFHFGEQIFIRHKDFIHDDLTRDRSAQRELALGLRRGQAVHALVENEAANAAVVVLGPDDEYIGDG